MRAVCFVCTNANTSFYSPNPNRQPAPSLKANRTEPKMHVDLKWYGMCKYFYLSSPSQALLYSVYGKSRESLVRFLPMKNRESLVHFYVPMMSRESLVNFFTNGKQRKSGSFFFTNDEQRKSGSFFKTNDEHRKSGSFFFFFYQ